MNNLATIETPPAPPQVQPGLYTAGQVAAALRISRRAVYYALSKVDSSGIIIRGESQHKTWSFSALPVSYREQFVTRARQLGFRSADHLLSSTVEEWRPRFALKDISQLHIDKAAKLQRALAWSLDHINDTNYSAADMEAQGLRDYAREYSHSISARHFRNLLERTLRRDGGAENWGRLEIYLDENIAEKRSPSLLEQTRSGISTHDLQDVIASFKDPVNPSHDEKAWLWSLVFEAYEQHIETGNHAKQVRRILINFLLAKIPALGKNATALRKQFIRKYSEWTQGGKHADTVKDERPCKSGHRRAPALTKEDEQILVAHSLECGGRLAQAWRELVRDRKLNGAVLSYYLNNPSSKSYVPKNIRSLVIPKIKMLMPLHHGPKWARTRGAFVERDPSTIRPWEWFQGDDSTLPVYYYEETERGFEVMRGQFLMMIDVATTFILGFVLISAPNYRALHIRNLISAIHDDYGLPNEGFYFENGPWKARLIVGGRDEVSWGQTEAGLRGQLGLRFQHARGPQSKIIERVFGSIQNYMEREPCYIGRDERRDCFERAQKAIALVKKGVHPAEVGMYSYDQWGIRLERICEEYNDEKQGGKYLDGISPHEAFESRAVKGGRKLSNVCRYLLASHVLKTRVGRNGISFRIGKTRYTYKSRETGERIGREVYLLFNPENPDLASFVDDMNVMKPCVVERAPLVPAMDAPEEVLELALAQNAAHEAPRHEYYRKIRHHFSATFLPRMMRGIVTDERTAQLGIDIHEQCRARMQRLHDERQINRQNRKLAARAGIGNARMDWNSDQTKAGLELMLEAQQEHQLGEKQKP